MTTEAEPTNGVQRKKPPVFTEEQLRCIHRDLARMPWHTDYLYKEWEEVLKMLSDHFGDDRSHVTHP